MNILDKMYILSDTAQFDLCDYVSPQKQLRPDLPGIYYTIDKNGCQIPLFKVLMSNKCSNDCKYCVNCSKRDFTRVDLSPDELTRVFLDYYTKGYVNGLFLTSGIPGEVDDSMENLVEVARLLRLKYGYSDYIHLKILPGSSKDIIKRAMELSNRVSLNIESASADGLAELSTTKDYNNDIIKRLKWIKDIRRRNPNFSSAGQTTQIIVGASNETDFDILDKIKYLYNKLDVQRAYFSSFKAFENISLKKEEPNPNRSNRLYQADALLNSYNFKLDELCFDDDGLLDLDIDPKFKAALSMDIFPLDVNEASFKDLIRVPGIGLISARKIVDIRKIKRFNSLMDLKKIGVVVSRSEKFVKFDGRYQVPLDTF